jgi:L-ascorbate metabolism protein UlaG (beta-lactamase superfamily)
VFGEGGSDENYQVCAFLFAGGGRWTGAALFDPGMYSPLDVTALQALDDIFITHEHPDHMDPGLLKKLQVRFPNVRITAPASAQAILEQEGIANVQTSPPEAVQLFEAPHEGVRPFAESDPPQEIGIHYLGVFTHPGDSHHFHETKSILALPVTAPWGSVVNAVSVALELRPKYVIPVHDWHWRDEARQQLYDRLEARFSQEGITFMKMIDGASVEINL